MVLHYRAPSTKTRANKKVKTPMDYSSQDGAVGDYEDFTNINHHVLNAMGTPTKKEPISAHTNNKILINILTSCKQVP